MEIKDMQALVSDKGSPDDEEAAAEDPTRNARDTPFPTATTLILVVVLAVIVGGIAIPLMLARTGKNHILLTQEKVSTDHRQMAASRRVDNVIPSPWYYDSQGTCLNNDQGEFPEETGVRLWYQPISRGLELSMGFGDNLNASSRTFEVEPSYAVLANGVVFNVETVTAPLPENLNKAPLTPAEITLAAREEAADFYRREVERKEWETGGWERPTFDASDIKMEVLSDVTSEEEEGLVFAGGHGFLAACMIAFAEHLPLRMAPDHLWAVIINGFARHVNRHAEELRLSFVSHEGQKKILVIFCEEPGDSNTKPGVWEDYVFPTFSSEISRNMNNSEAYEVLTSPFSTTTPTRQAAVDVVLMAAMKNYFKYMLAACGIPKIYLDGTRDDWVFLRDRTERLAQWMMQNDTHGDLWIYDVVLPILDEFVKSYDGNVDYCFWQSMIKIRSQVVLGPCANPDDPWYDTVKFMTGWLATLYPYLSPMEGDSEDPPNPYLKRWDQSASANSLGPDPEDIPTLISSAPVVWEHCTTMEEYKIHFNAGFRGVKQHKTDGTVEPVLGWYISYDPEESD